MAEWKKVGQCPVDAGMVMLVDPCYVLPNSEDSEPKYTYNQLLALCEKKGWDEKSYGLPATYGEMGVVVSSGFGDGCYDVFAKIVYCGDWGKRVAEVKVVFIQEDEYD